MAAFSSGTCSIRRVGSPAASHWTQAEPIQGRQRAERSVKRLPSPTLVGAVIDDEELEALTQRLDGSLRPVQGGLRTAGLEEGRGLPRPASIDDARGRLP